jgi:anhydro-N-acetylmuramic acid kinase
MSGTSLDGLDIVFSNFKLVNKRWKYEIVSATTVSYTESLKNSLKEAELLSGLELSLLNNYFGDFIGSQIKCFLSELNLKADLICSHGHTVFHQPENRLTLQIGNGANILAKTNTTTVTNFRDLDIALGGEGAPLVPNGEIDLFPEYNYFLNLGGIANISIHQNESVFGFDITAANMLLNYLCKKYFNREFDKNGELAKEGEINNNILLSLGNIDYFSKEYPKSLGKEFVFQKMIPIIDIENENPKNLLRTAVAHIANEIFSTIETLDIKKEVLISGGGALNSFLISELKKKYSKFVIPNKDTIEYKEALIFAFLGLKRHLGEINSLSSVTGSKKDTSSGSIFLA